MTKILILGDSFGDCSSCWPHRFPDVGPGWAELLEQHTNFKITNLSQGGSSIYYSYKLFIKNYKEYDQIIFLATQPGRISLQIKNYTSNHEKNHHSAESVRNLKLELKHDPIALNYLEALEDYFIYLQDSEYDQYAQYTFIDHIQRLRPDTILIPCFEDSLRLVVGDCMEKIGMKEIQYLFNKTTWDDQIYRKLREKGLSEARKCHMSEENNFIFYQDVLRWLAGDPVFINVNKFVLPSKPVSHYWRNY